MSSQPYIFKELRQKVSIVGSEDQAEGLFVRGRTEKDQEKSRGNSKSKSKLRKNIECHIVISLNTIKKIIVNSKKKEKNVRMKSQDKKSSIFSVCRINLHITWDSFSYHPWCPFTTWVSSWFRLFLSHMSLQRLFVTYQPIDGGNVLIGNNMACKTISISTIKIRKTRPNLGRTWPDLKAEGGIRPTSGRIWDILASPRPDHRAGHWVMSPYYAWIHN